MPRQPGGITKFERIQALKGVLERWGRLGKNQIDQQVAAVLNCSAGDLERALYRDLEELERMGEIVAIHYSRDGVEIEEYDPETHRNTLCRWAIPGQERAILGAQRLKESQISFLAAGRLRDAFDVREAKEAPARDKISIYFQLEGRAHCLRLAREGLPAKIVLGRFNEDLKDSDLVKLMEEEFGKRASYWLVPLGNLSKVKDRAQPGHLCLDFSSSGKVTLRDFKSKNGTHYVPLDPKRAEGLILELAFMGEATLTDSASRFRDQMIPKSVPGGSEIELSLPVLVQASQAFDFIIC